MWPFCASIKSQESHVDGVKHRAYVTISVDDGHPTDFRTAELLAAFALQATFYIPAANPERKVLSAPEIKTLAQRFEVGGHTMSHCTLTRLPTCQVRSEVVGCKEWLEELTGTRTLAFCYPRGKFDQRVSSVVKKAGFRGARTCVLNLHGWPRDPFAWGVSTQAFPHPALAQVRHAIIEANLRGLWNFFSLHHGARDWEDHFVHALDHVEATGGIAHLYLHSWEIEQQNMWEKLHRVLKQIVARDSVESVTNGKLFELWDSSTLSRMPMTGREISSMPC
jgi:peptidoglycan-N-acetylglucosamine deacetylase